MPVDFLGRAPGAWVRTTLGEIVKSGNGVIQTGPFGSQLHASDYVSVGIPSVMPVNIGDNQINETGIARITEFDAERLRRYRLMPGDIVYSRRGDIERRALVREHEAGWLCGTGCLMVRFGNGDLDSRFASYYLDHPAIRQWLVQHAVGATMPNLNIGIMQAIPFIVPPIEEQRAIASVLGAFDEKIELNRRASRTLEAMVRTVFKSWFIDFDPVHAKAAGKPPPGLAPEVADLFPAALTDTPAGPVPEGWQIVDLPEAIEVNPKRKLKKGTAAPYLEMSNMPTGGGRALHWVDRDFKSGSKFVDGDTLMARITPCLENGKTAFVDFLGDGTVGWGSTEYIVLRPEPPLPPEYAYFLARDPAFRVHAISNMTGTSGRQRVPPSALDRYPVVVPAEKVAVAFGKIASDAFALMRHRDEESRNLAAARDALLPKLLSGTMRIPVG